MMTVRERIIDMVNRGWTVSFPAHSRNMRAYAVRCVREGHECQRGFRKHGDDKDFEEAIARVHQDVQEVDHDETT